MKKFLGAIAALVLTVGLTAGATSPAAADESPGKVSRGEYAKIKSGMHISKVKKITGANGKRYDLGDGIVVREYKTTFSKNARVDVYFDRGEVFYKAKYRIKPWLGDTPYCVSKSEYRQIKGGMSRRQVRNTVGDNGSAVWQSAGYVGVDYPACTSEYGVVSVTYYGGEVDSKYAYWG